MAYYSPTAVSKVVAGESTFTLPSNCILSKSSTTLANLTDDSDCPGPSIVTQNYGTWQTTDNNNLIQSITNLPLHNYIAEVWLQANSSTNAQAHIAITDGTTTCEVPGPGGSSYSQTYVSCYFPSISGSKTFQVQVRAPGGTVSIDVSITVRFRLSVAGDP
jgi:Tfp pilus assembly protein PilX